MNTERKIERYLKAAPKPSEPDRLLERLQANIPNRDIKSKHSILGRWFAPTGGSISGRRVAAAAVIAIAVLLPLSYGATKLIKRFAAISQLAPIEADFSGLGVLSPDGKHFAGVTWDEELVVIDTATGEQRKIATGCFDTVVWSEDGSEIAVRGWDEAKNKSRIVAVALATGEMRTLSPRRGGFVDWSSDGKYLLAVRGNTPAFRIALIDLETNELITLARHTEVWPDPILSPNGQWVSYVAKQNGRSILHVQEIGGTNHLSYSDFPGDISRPLWSPDGSHIIFTGTQSGIDLEFKDLWALRIETNRFVGAPFPVIPDVEQMKFCNFSRNGQLAYRTGFRLGGIFTLPVDLKTGKATGAPQQLVRANSGSFCWSPDGKQIAVRGSGGLNFISASSGEKLQSVSLPQIRGNNIKYAGRGMSWSPDGKWIALPGWVGGERPGLFLTSVDGKEVKLLVPLGDRTAALNCDPTWSPDSKTIAYGNSNDIFVVNIEDGKPQRITPPSENQRSKSSNRPVFAPDGKSVAYLFGFENNFGERLLTTTVDGQQTRQILSLEGRDFSINIFDLSPDGRYVVFTPGNAEIWCARTDGGEPFKIADVLNVGSNAWAWMPKWSPKGDAITFTVSCEEYQYWVMENFLPTE